MNAYSQYRAMKMKKNHVIQTANSVNIDVRIAQFVDKLSGLDQSSVAYANACTTEKRYLQGRYPAFRTYSNVLSKYRAALALMPVCHHTFEKNALKLVAKYPHLNGVLVGECAKDVILAVKLHLKDLDALQAGEFNALSKLKIACKAYHSLRVTKEQSVTISKANQAAVVAKKADKVEVSLPIVKAVVKSNLFADSLAKRALALSLCTGRRPIEIFKTARFEKVDNHTVRFFGQAKNKGTGVRDGYEIPILFAKVDDFLKAFGAFRAMTNERGYAELTAAQVHSRASKTSSQVTRELLQNDQISFYTCRAIYAAQACDTVKPAGQDSQVYIAAILGHSSADIQTAQSYESVILVNHAPTPTAPRIIERVLPLGVKKDLPVTSAKKAAQRFKKIQALQMEGRALTALHGWIIEHLKDEPAAVLTQTYINNRRPTSRPAIKKYLELLGDLVGI